MTEIEVEASRVGRRAGRDGGEEPLNMPSWFAVEIREHKA